MALSPDKYLTVMHRAVKEVLIPELQSENAKRTGAVLLGTLEKLLKEELVVPQLLTDALPKGIERAIALSTALQQAGFPQNSELVSNIAPLQPGVFSAGPRGLRAQLDTLSAAVEAALLPYFNRLAEDPAAVDEPVMRAWAEFSRWELDLLLAELEPLTSKQIEQPAPVPLTFEKLQQFLRATLPEEPSLEITDFEPLVGGMSSKSMFRFNLRRASGEIEGLVARCAPVPALIDVSCFYLDREFALVRDLAKTGYPLPEPLWFSGEPGDVPGNFYVMRKVQGAGSGGLFSNAPIPEAALLDMAEWLARLHTLPMDTFARFIRGHENPSVYTCTAAAGARGSLARLIKGLKAARRRPLPIELYVLAWAYANVPPNDEPVSMLHGDFTPHNCLFHEGRLSAVLDWECGEIGDPAADLGYVRPQIEARMSWDKFMDRYETVSGKKISAERLKFYANFFHLRTLVCCNIVGTRVYDGSKMDISALLIDYEYFPRVAQMCLEGTAE